VEGRRVIGLFKFVEDMKDSRVGSMLGTEAMLVGVKNRVFVPDLLDPSSDHTGPQFPDDLKERDRPNLGKIVITLFLG
jgi:hypothetical protein